MNSGTFRASLRLRRFEVPRLTVLVLGVLAAGIPTTSHAKVDIEGAATALRVTTSKDAISDVLAAISTAVNVRYRASIPLNATISGTYSGSAERVIARLLEGYDFVIGHNGNVIEVSVFGRGPSAARARPPSRPNSVAAVPAVIDLSLGRLVPDTTPPAPSPPYASPVPAQAPAGTAPAFAPLAAYPKPDPLGPAVVSFSRAPAQDSARSFDPAGEAASSFTTGLVPAAPPGGISEPAPTAGPLLSPAAGQMAALRPGSTPTPAIPPDPAEATVLSPRRVQKSVSSRPPASEFSWMFPESSYSRAARVPHATGGPGQQRSPEQHVADTRARQAPTVDTEQSTPLQRLVRTLSAAISRVLQP